MNKKSIMKQIIVLLIIAGVILSCAQSDNKSGVKVPQNSTEIKVVNNGNVNYANYFTDKTMRFDYFHSGTALEEHFALDRIVSDGIWSGSRKTLIDEIKLGLYFFEVIDTESNVLLYSKGFASVFGEWQTIPEASENWGTFHESIRLPWPKKPVKLILKKRDATNNFSTIWTTEIDPSSRKVNPAELT
jgi:hypothetical protein